MNRADFLAGLGAVTVAPLTSPAIGVDVTVKCDANELLAPFSVAIALRNPTQQVMSLDFPTADIYRIDVRDEAGDAIWSTATGHKPLLIQRRIDVAPGLTRLAIQIVDGTTDDHRAYAPGRYQVHVAMLGKTLTTAVDKPIAFNAPVAIAQARRESGGTVVTIAGLPFSDAGVFTLRDDTGTLRLSRPLGPRPTGTYVVRGYLDAAGDDVQFAVGRFAPAFDNLDQARPTSHG